MKKLWIWVISLICVISFVACGVSGNKDSDGGSTEGNSPEISGAPVEGDSSDDSPENEGNPGSGNAGSSENEGNPESGNAGSSENEEENGSVVEGSGWVDVVFPRPKK